MPNKKKSNKPAKGKVMKSGYVLKKKKK